MMAIDHSTALAALVGRSMGKPFVALDLVNEPMIRHWAEAMGDTNPVYVDDATARQVGLDGIIAPPTMLQAWSMVGLTGTLEREARRGETSAVESANETMMRLLDEEGFTSVVATNCEQEYVRPLRPGERIVTTAVIDSISDVKKTGLGVGRFTTSRIEFFSVGDPFPSDADAQAAALADAERVGTMLFRILKFAPQARTPERPPRPRPAITQDNAFFFEGLREGKLLIQRCTSCSTLRHPPLPGCGVCGSLEWDAIESTGHGEIYSFVVVHYPQVPAFEYPLPIGLILLDEGTRIVANLAMDPEEVAIGARVVARIESFDEDLSLPVFELVKE
jgi:uncharacterized OB-fold protein/acyl dehydratase